MDRQLEGWMGDGLMDGQLEGKDGWMDEWMEVKGSLRIGYSNQKNI